MVQTKTILYNLIKKYQKEYQEKTNKQVKDSIKFEQQFAIKKYIELNGKRKIDNFIIK